MSYLISCCIRTFLIAFRYCANFCSPLRINLNTLFCQRNPQCLAWLLSGLFLKVPLYARLLFLFVNLVSSGGGAFSFSEEPPQAVSERMRTRLREFLFHS